MAQLNLVTRRGNVLCENFVENISRNSVQQVHFLHVFVIIDTKILNRYHYFTECDGNIEKG